MKNRGVLLKLLLLVSISVLAMCAVGIFGINSNKTIYASVDRVNRTAEEFQRGALKITDPLNALRRLTLTMVMAPDDELQGSLNDEQQQLTSQLDQTLQQWDVSALSEREKAAFEQLRGSWNDYREIKEVTAAKVMGGYREEAFINAIQAESDQFQIVNDQVKAWQTAIIEHAAEVNDSANQTSNNTYWVFLSIIALATLVIGGFGYLTMRRIIVPIELLKNTASRIAAQASMATIGKALDERIEVDSEDEVGALAAAFNQMVESLRAAMVKLNVEEQNLREMMGKLNVEEKRTQAILNSTADGILTVDAEGRVLSLNAAAESLLKYQTSELSGQNVAKIVPAFRENGLLASSKPLNSGESRLLGRESETYGVDKHGKQLPIALRVTEMEFSGERIYIATLQDIEPRRQAEQERSRLFEAIRETVNHLSSASKEISGTMQQQSVGSEKQVTVVSQTVSAVNEAAQKAQESIHLAEDVADTARRADDVGLSGRKAVESTRVAMNTVRERVESTAESILMLAERAKAIGVIITTVNDIADQTSLLALNAAIEASRAGEAGRGFSVVAAEVKSLAQQAKKSTEQVRNILSEIQQATDNAVSATGQGTESVGEANHVVVQAEQTIEELGTMVSRAAKSAARIVAASNQQANSMSQITEAMSEIDLTAKQTLTATQQTTLAAADLNKLGQRLAELLAG